MRNISGNYRMDAAAAHYFGSDTIKLLARDSRVIGRFGRRGVIRGTADERRVDAYWRDPRHEGWITLRFAPDYGTCAYMAGAKDEPAAVEGMLVRQLHTRRSRAKAS